MILARKKKHGIRFLSICLLYTSDAADEEDSVDLGGRRIIKKNLILGRNELGFRDQDVPRSREQHYSNISLFFSLKKDIGH